eukprot:8992374-Pyramimonas_sp.AAC.1
MKCHVMCVVHPAPTYMQVLTDREVENMSIPRSEQKARGPTPPYQGRVSGRSPTTTAPLPALIQSVVRLER